MEHYQYYWVYITSFSGLRFSLSWFTYCNYRQQWHNWISRSTVAKRGSSPCIQQRKSGYYDLRFIATKTIDMYMPTKGPWNIASFRYPINVIPSNEFDKICEFVMRFSISSIGKETILKSFFRFISLQKIEDIFYLWTNPWNEID